LYACPLATGVPGVIATANSTGLPEVTGDSVVDVIELSRPCRRVRLYYTYARQGDFRVLPPVTVPIRQVAISSLGSGGWIVRSPAWLTRRIKSELRDFRISGINPSSYSLPYPTNAYWFVFAAHNSSATLTRGASAVCADLARPGVPRAPTRRRGTPATVERLCGRPTRQANWLPRHQCAEGSRAPLVRAAFRDADVVSRPSRPHELRDELRQDAGRSLVIRVQASLNSEAAPTRVLDGHVDIACECDHLFFGEHAPARPVPTTTTA